MGEITLRIVTPSGEPQAYECDSIILTVCDDIAGKGGGSYGIRKGHAKALIALDEGKITASLGGSKVLSAHTSSGFAMVENNVVTVTVENID
ncbi:MAG: hypothetical protein IKL62_06310 [Clostridia bacterium]|nr:hypothetical protein [Clostridia bacterium]